MFKKVIFFFTFMTFTTTNSTSDCAHNADCGVIKYLVKSVLHKSIIWHVPARNVISGWVALNIVSKKRTQHNITQSCVLIFDDLFLHKRLYTAVPCKKKSLRKHGMNNSKKAGMTLNWCSTTTKETRYWFGNLGNWKYSNC